MKLTQGLYSILISAGCAYVEHNPPPSLDDGLQLECILDSTFPQSSVLSKTYKRGNTLMGVYFLSTLCNTCNIIYYLLPSWTTGDNCWRPWTDTGDAWQLDRCANIIAWFPLYFIDRWRFTATVSDCIWFTTIVRIMYTNTIHFDSVSGHLQRHCSGSEGVSLPKRFALVSDCR